MQHFLQIVKRQPSSTAWKAIKMPYHFEVGLRVAESRRRRRTRKFRGGEGGSNGLRDENLQRPCTVVATRRAGAPRNRGAKNASFLQLPQG